MVDGWRRLRRRNRNSVVMLGLTEMTKKKGGKPCRCSIRRLTCNLVKMGTKYGCMMIRIIRIVDDETVLLMMRQTGVKYGRRVLMTHHFGRGGR